MCVYKIEEIAEKVRPIAEYYGTGRIYLFGSYARGEANEDSDVDLLVDAENVNGLKFFGLYEDLRQAFDKKIDLVTFGQIEQNRDVPFHKQFIEAVEAEKKVIY